MWTGPARPSAGCCSRSSPVKPAVAPHFQQWASKGLATTVALLVRFPPCRVSEHPNRHFDQLCTLLARSWCPARARQRCLGVLRGVAQRCSPLLCTVLYLLGAQTRPCGAMGRQRSQCCAMRVARAGAREALWRTTCHCTRGAWASTNQRRGAPNRAPQARVEGGQGAAATRRLQPPLAPRQLRFQRRRAPSSRRAPAFRGDAEGALAEPGQAS